MQRTRMHWWLPALLLGVVSAGCSREQELQLQDRYVRQFRPYEDAWKRESEIPAEPQRYPHMVMWEVSNYPPGAKPSPAQQRAADALVERCQAAAREHGWYDYEKGRADGFDVTDDQRHYENRANLLDARILDCDRPEYLMYYPGPNGTHQLVGFMFFTRSLTERGPQIGGPLTVWHYHRWSDAICTRDGVIQADWAVNGECKEGVPSHRSPEMLHVWLVERTQGPFSTSMYLKDYLEGLDALVVAPPGDDLALFQTRLDAAMAKLDEEDRRLVTQALSYLEFAFGKGVTEKGEAEPEAQGGDPGTRGRLGLLRAAQRRGSRIRLRNYVALASELDRVRPELWAEYEATHPSEAGAQAPHHHH
jgi:hypothetical protein